jgi:hypothetical protein
VRTDCVMWPGVKVCNDVAPGCLVIVGISHLQHHTIPIVAPCDYFFWEPRTHKCGSNVYNSAGVPAEHGDCTKPLCQQSAQWHHRLTWLWILARLWSLDAVTYQASFQAVVKSQTSATKLLQNLVWTLTGNYDLARGSIMYTRGKGGSTHERH